MYMFDLKFSFFFYIMMQVGVIVAQSLHVSLLHIVTAPACMSLCRMGEGAGGK